MCTLLVTEELKKKKKKPRPLGMTSFGGEKKHSKIHKDQISAGQLHKDS